MEIDEGRPSLARKCRFRVFSGFKKIKQSRRIPVYLLLVGLNRSMSKTSDSIVSSLIRPLERNPFLNLNVSLTLLAMNGNQIQNPRSREAGYLETEIPTDLRRFPVLTLQSADLIKDSALDFEIQRQFPDFWVDGYVSLRNVLVDMRAQFEAYKKFVAPAEPGVVIFARPDSIVSGRLFLNFLVFLTWTLSMIRPGWAFVPSWGHFGGLNDRFGIMDALAAGRYFTRYLGVGLYRSPQGFHAETFLAQSLANVRVLRVITASLYRVRIGGIIEPRDVAKHSGRKLGNRLRASSKRLLISFGRLLWSRGQ